MAEIKFEDALKRMEKIVEELEGGKLTLEEAVKKYEEGIKLSLVCSKALDSARRKVEVLMKKEGAPPNARFETKDFENKNKDD